MKIAVCSDIHDNIWALERALKKLGVGDVLLFCGDFCSPFTLVQLAEGFYGPIHVVWGNNDGDKWLLTQSAASFPRVDLHGELAEISADSLRVAMTHYPQVAEGLAHSGRYDLVCYGHNHEARNELVGNCRILNPGELMGRLGTPTIAFFDTASSTATIEQV